MSTGEIKTFYSDKEKTNPVFPRTKMNAISDSDGTGLHAYFNGVVYANDKETDDTIIAPINADTLGGVLPENYALKTDIPEFDDTLSIENCIADAKAVGDALATKAPAGYGLGESVGRYCADCHAVTENGFYYIDDNTVNKPTNVTNCIMLAQITPTVNGNDIYLSIKSGYNDIRCYYSSWAKAWQEWKTFTVDYIVDQGTSGNWHYRKWNNGLAECWGIHTGVALLGHASYNNTIYAGYTSLNLPFTFTSVDNVNYSCHYTSGYDFCGKAIVNENKSVNFYIMSCSSITTGAAGKINVYVSGRWKA